MKASFVLAPFLLATISKAGWSNCRGAGRCCQCRHAWTFDNAWTAIVGEKAGSGSFSVGATNYGDTGDGIFFCRMMESQEFIQRECHRGGITKSYNCWDC